MINLPFPSGAATLGANTLTATQTIDGANLDLDASTATTGNLTKAGVPFLHNWGRENTFLGIGAGSFSESPSNTGNNTGIGFSALASNTGVYNTAIGGSALAANTSGNANTGLGALTLRLNTTGVGNTAVGAGALHDNTTGQVNVAVGEDALQHNTTASANVAVGKLALWLNTTGFDNVAAGNSALEGNTTGVDNVAIGREALLDSDVASGNTAIGRSALLHVTGSNNVAVGRNAGANIVGGSNNIHIGGNLFGTPGDTNTIRIGLPGVQTRAFIGGIRGTTTGFNDAVPVLIDGNGQLGTINSSRRVKEDIRDMADASSRLMKLRPVAFRYRQAYADGSKPVQFGLIAEEVADAFPELAVRGRDGEVQTVHYETLSVLLLNEWQKERRVNDEQQRRLAALEREVAALKRERSSSR